MNTLALINLLLYTRCDLDPRPSYQNSYTSRLCNRQTFDFIVVGGGTAGAIVANRLSENGTYKVLVLEAGGFPTIATEVPGFWSQTFQTELDWDYEIEPGVNHSLAYTNCRSKLPRGKVLGGCSSFNGMLYVRGLPSDYDKWADMGNPGWDWQSVLQSYRKAERAVGKTSPNFGTSGPLTISRINITDPMYDAILKASEEANIPVLSEEGGNGIFEAFRTVDNGTRCSSAKAYLAHLKRRNLYIATNVHVTRILFRRNNAIGVEVSRNGKLIEVYVRKEVILSAGAINSPQILMLSGIGPAEHLKKMGIPLKVNLPVGRRLVDHYVIKGFFVKLNPSDTSNVCLADAALDYCLAREGPMTNFGTSALQWSFSTKNDEIPDMKIYFMYAQKGNGGAVKTYLRGFGLNNQTISSFDKLIAEFDVFSLSIATARPKSVGYVELRSNNSFAKPLVYANYLSDEKEEDINAMVASISHLKKFLLTPTMQKFNAEIAQIDVPKCNETEFDTEEYYVCIMRNLGSTGCHMASSCKMGPSTDVEAVVDERLRVYGVNGLRVVDASIMPMITNRNTMAPVVMIGEKGATLILKDWK